MSDIWEYTAQRDIDSADKAIDSLTKLFDLLDLNPKIGTIKPEISGNIYCFPHKNYLIFYILGNKGIEIYRIIHSARNIKKLL